MKKNPHLKYKCDIIQTSELYGANDIFEVFICQKDKLGYIVYPNDINLEVFQILNNKKILSLEGHLEKLTMIRYFINNKNSKEYLISGDLDKLVIIWDITNNFKSLYKIKTKYGNTNYIFSCLLVFPHYDNNNNYIITSSSNSNDDYEKSSTKIFSLENGQYIRYISKSQDYSIFYLISWHNKKNDSYYIIQLAFHRIVINNLLENEFYSKFENIGDTYSCGFIYPKNNIDYLYASSSRAIYILDLLSKQLVKKIEIRQSNIKYIIEWNRKYLIAADNNIKSIKIIDLNLNKVISNFIVKNTNSIKCVKKLVHPHYGETLLSNGDYGDIKLWTI